MVRDTGIGIPAEMLPRVFAMFTQVDRALDRSHDGLGIGLTLVKRLVDMHGGTIRTHSEGPGKGSEFIVRLPSSLSRRQRCTPEAVRVDSTASLRNGYDAAQTIRRQPWGKRMVLIATTGWSQEADRHRSKEAGFDHHLVKPVDPAALMQLLASLEQTVLDQRERHLARR